MADSNRKTISRDAFDAVLFDLDGVITATADIHAVAWKNLFDGYLRARADASGAPFRAFDIEADYVVYVDGKPRYEGVQSFLKSRDIHLDFGTPDDAADLETACGLGNRKNILFNNILRDKGAHVFDNSVECVKALIDAGIRVAVVSSSKNCVTVLKSAGISDLFEVRIDGAEAAKLGLPGKPNPDTFLEAARRLGVTAARAVVVEDAISGVQAGRAGNFGLVVGVDRTGEADALRENGAHIVVEDLGELNVE